MNILTYANTEQGGREYNEDYFGYLYDGERKRGIWVIADGLGGHSHGEIASRLITETMVTGFENLTVFNDESLINLALYANERLLIVQEADPSLRGMKSTLNAAFIESGIIKTVHAGDSRFYLFRNNEISFSTNDHSVPWMAMEAGEISYDDIRFHDERNVLLKVMGLGNLNLTNCVNTVEFACGDAFLLCTDGFWEYVFESEMIDALSLSADPCEWYRRMCERIASRAPADADNFSAVCSFVVEE